VRHPVAGDRLERRTQLFVIFERQFDAVVCGDLLPHLLHLRVGTILHSLLAGFGTLGKYRVG
jgi:hypothetical protein